MNIEKSLKDYRKTKGKIETIKLRINHWQECLDTMTDEEIASEFIYESFCLFRILSSYTSVVNNYFLKGYFYYYKLINLMTLY